MSQKDGLQTIPALENDTGSAHLQIMIKMLISEPSKHEYGLVVTFTRLTLKIVDSYNYARTSLEKFYTDNSQTIQISSLLRFSNNIETCVTNLYRLARTFEELCKHYPIYRKQFSSQDIELIQEIKTKTNQLRNKSEHIYESILGQKTIRETKMGAINFHFDGEYVVLSTYKIKVSELKSWVEKLSSYSNTIAEVFCDDQKDTSE